MGYKHNDRCLDAALPEEPIFVLLGRDKSAPLAVFVWVLCRLIRRKNRWADPQIQEAIAHAKTMRSWVRPAKPSVPQFSPITGLSDDERELLAGMLHHWAGITRVDAQFPIPVYGESRERCVERHRLLAEGYDLLAKRLEGER